MDEYESLSHSRWECKYHVVFIPKCRRKVLYGQLRKHLGEVFRKLAEQKESRIEEGHLLSDHVHMMISIPPKYAVSQVVGLSKARVRYSLRGRMEIGNRTTRGRVSGRAATSYRQSGAMKPRSASTSATRSRKISDWTR